MIGRLKKGVRVFRTLVIKFEYYRQKRKADGVRAGTGIKRHDLLFKAG